MKKINIVTKNTEFNRIITKYKSYRYKDYFIYLEISNELENYKFGISISKKICNAVGRNKIKRQLKNIIDKKIYQNNFNCIIIVRKSILNKTYLEINDDLLNILTNLGIVKGEKHEEK